MHRRLARINGHGSVNWGILGKKVDVIKHGVSSLLTFLAYSYSLRPVLRSFAEFKDAEVAHSLGGILRSSILGLKIITESMDC